jgi:hypothetical protein
MISAEFRVDSGVCQGGILFPILFRVNVDDFIEALRDSRYGCYVNKIFVGCIMIADDLLLLSHVSQACSIC